MISHIYKIGIWRANEKLSDIDCKIYTDNISQTLKDIRSMDFQTKVDPFTRFTLKYVTREDIKVMNKPHIGYINKSKIKVEDHGMQTQKTKETETT